VRDPQVTAIADEAAATGTLPLNGIVTLLLDQTYAMTTRR